MAHRPDGEQHATLLERELVQMREELQRFVYGVSHDLHGPLRAVVAFSRILMESRAQLLDEKGLHYLNFICQGGEKAQALLDGLLVYSRLNTQAEGLKPTGSAQVASDCLAALKGPLEGCGGQVSIDTLPTVLADEGQLRQLFQALLDNALKFRRPDTSPCIRIACERRDDMWRFCLQDNGIGIAPEFHRRIFELFKRLHTDRDYPGIGMGLTIARKIVERHGGTLEVESRAGQGTAFFFTLPALYREIER